MKKYALIRNGVVQSVFESDLPKESFPDVAEFLMEVGPEVRCNDLCHEGRIFPRPAPVAVVDASGEFVAYAQPQVNFVKRTFNWADLALGLGSAGAALAAQYFLTHFGGQ